MPARAHARAHTHTHTHTHTSCDTHFQLLSIEKTLPYLFHENTNNAHTHVLCWYITKDSTCPTAVLLMQSRATLAFWRHKDGGRERMPKDGAWQRVRAWSHSLETWDEQKYRMRKFWKFCEEGGMSKQGTPKKRQMRHLLMTWSTSSFSVEKYLVGSMKISFENDPEGCPIAHCFLALILTASPLKC